MSKVMSILEKYNLVEKVNKENPKDTSLDGGNNIQLDKIPKDENIEVEPKVNKEEIKAPQRVVKEKSPELDIDKAYENKMKVDEIYTLHGLENSNINTVFMLQNLINALPQNLPKDVIKQSVINVINASNIDLNELISDGEKRQKTLYKVMDEYHNQTNKCIKEHKEEIDRLSKLINSYEEQIKIKEDLLEEQIYEIKYESQKIESIIDFFSK